MASLSPKKSTNVRLTVLRAGVGTLGAFSPAAAAAVLERLFLRTRRRPTPERELHWLAGSVRTDFESRGTRLASWSWGRGPAVLLAHGWEGRGSQMGAFVTPLVAAGYRVVAFDAPGHGRSPGRRSSLVEMADAIVDAGRSFGPLHGLVAHSAGAAAASIAVGRGCPVSRLVFLAPPLDLRSHLDSVTEKLRLPPSIARLTRERIERRFGVPWESLEIVPLARAMTAPLLLLHDEGDREVPIEHAVELGRHWPGARLERTRGLGHRRILRDTAVVDLAVRFLRGEKGHHERTHEGARAHLPSYS